MAILHSAATIRPTKRELLETVLGGSVEVVGSYRFDDPAGQVGIEAFVVRRGEQLKHVVFTYRGAPVESDDARLVSTMEHSELGPRWVYDGTTDSVAIDCFRRALMGEQDLAVFELWEAGRLVETRQSSVQLRATPGTPVADGTLHIAHDLDPDEAAHGAALVATWAGGEADVATLDG
jgi:hypothetical protein